MVQVVDPELRLQRLRDLHRQIGTEIATLQERVDAAALARLAQQERATRAAADARQAQADLERAKRAAEREAASARAAQDASRIEALAPTDTVRAWARNNGIPVGERGRIPLDLRKQYLSAQPTRK